MRDGFLCLPMQAVTAPLSAIVEVDFCSPDEWGWESSLFWRTVSFVTLSLYTWRNGVHPNDPNVHATTDSSYNETIQSFTRQVFLCGPVLLI